jgi:chemotaxis protein methyltransferase CheR
MRDQDIEYVINLIRDNSGVVLTKEKIYLIETRFYPLMVKYKKNKIHEFIDFVRTSGNDALKREVIDSLMTNETMFFRNSKPFEDFKDKILPYLLEQRQNTKKIRIWCAGCSSGQEPYSLAMILHEHKHLMQGWNVSIVATDISHGILEKAKSGKFTQFEVQRGLPITSLVKYFDKSDNNWVIKDEIKDYVTFQYFNLLDDPVLFGGFDIVFCRNVIIYFSLEDKKRVLEGFKKVLKSDGFLILGGSETTLGITESFSHSDITRNIYVMAKSA